MSETTTPAAQRGARAAAVTSALAKLRGQCDAEWDECCDGCGKDMIVGQHFYVFKTNAPECVEAECVCRPCAESYLFPDRCRRCVTEPEPCAPCAAAWKAMEDEWSNQEARGYDD